MYDWNEIRQDVENFCSEMEKEWYLNWAGLKEEMNLSAIYDKYRHLFTKELILAVKEERKHAKGEEERKLRYLQQFFVGEYLGTTVREFTDKAETMESKENIKVDGEDIPFRLAAVKIANEPNRERRSKLFEARNRVIDKINVVLLERMEKLHETSRELGYTNYMSLFKDIKGIDFQRLEKLMRDFIAKTESIYTTRMDKALLEKVGVKLKDAEKHDLAFFFRAKEFDTYFKKEDAVGTLRKTLANMDLRLERQKNIEVDVEERPKKSPRAFCCGVKVPDDVKLVIMPKGGHDDYAALFHEAGHAEHFGCVNSDLAVEYKRLGDNSVTETFAFLLEYLLTDENWLRQYTPLKEAEEYLAFLYLYKLYFLRRYGGKLSYELKLHTAETLKEMDKIYKQTLEEALKFKHPANHYLTDHDDGFYCAQYLRAWIFEEQLKAILKERFGEKWFNNREAGTFLKDLWVDGQKYDVVELAQMLGYKDLSIDLLLSSLQRHLG